MKTLHAGLALMLLLAGSAYGANKPDKNLGSGTMTGKLEGFVWGDYLHAQVKGAAGKTQNLFIGDVEACFMALHAGESLTIQYDKLSRYFPEAGGYSPANVVTQIQAKGADFQSWVKTYSSKRDFERCETLTEKFTLPEADD